MFIHLRNLFKPDSKLISKVVNVIYYGGCYLEILKRKLIKSTWMKAKVNILKTWSLGTKHLRKKINFKRIFENEVWFWHIKNPQLPFILFFKAYLFWRVQKASWIQLLCILLSSSIFTILELHINNTKTNVGFLVLSFYFLMWYSKKHILCFQAFPVVLPNFNVLEL